jgi:hypothetical protein
MRKSTKIWRRILSGTLGVLAFLVIAPPLIIQIPRVQQALKNVLVKQLSSRLDTRVEVGRIQLAWFLDVAVRDVGIYDRSDSLLLGVDRLILDVGRLQLRQHSLQIKRVVLEKPAFHLRFEKDDQQTNLDQLLSGLNGSDTDTTSSPVWQLSVKRLDIERGSFSYHHTERLWDQEGIDFNHIALDSLYLRLTSWRTAADTQFFTIDHLALREQSGFLLDTLEAIFQLSNTGLDAQELFIRTPLTRLRMDLHFENAGWHSYNDFIDSVYVQSEIHSGNLAMNDIAFFAPEIRGMDNQFGIRGHIMGTVNSFRARDLSVSYGSATYLLADLDVNGLPDVRESFVDARFHKFLASASDLDRFLLPGGATLGPLPEILSRLDILSTKGVFTGFFNDFVAEAQIITPLASVRADLVLKQGSAKQGLLYSGTLSGDEVNLGKLLEAEQILGRMSMDMSVNGSGLDWTSLNMKLEGRVDSLELLGERIRSLDINGALAGKEFRGELRVQDPVLAMHFDGLVNFEAEPHFDFFAAVEHIRLDKLDPNAKRGPLWGSGDCVMNFSGNDIDRLKGTLNVENLRIRDGEHTFYSRNLMVSFEPDATRYKAVRLRSDFADADLEGSFLFDNLIQWTAYELAQLLPSAGWTNVPSPPDRSQFARAEILVYETSPLTNIFFPSLYVEAGSHIAIEFREGDTVMHFDCAIPAISWNQVRAERLVAGGQLLAGELHTAFQMDQLALTDTLIVYTPHLQSRFARDSAGFLARWSSNPDSAAIQGILQGMARLPDTGILRLRLTQSLVPVDNRIWQFNEDHGIIFDSNGVQFRNVVLVSEDQMLRLNGRADEKPDSRLGMQFHQFDLALLNVFLAKYGLSTGGRVNGDLTAMGVLGNPLGTAQLNIASLTLNGDVLGNASIQAGWNPLIKELDLDASVIYRGNAGINYPLEIKGRIIPEHPEENFDLDIRLQNLKLATFQPYLEVLSSEVSGFLSGEMHLGGSYAQPELVGSLTARRAALKVDYLNEVYSFTHEISLTPKGFEVKDLILYDRLGKQAVMNGGIYHKHFADFTTNLEIRPTQFAALNTSQAQNEQFYGTAFASGILRLSGPFEDILMEINARTEKGTKVFIPISYDAEIAERGFIVFVDPSREEETLKEEPANVSGFRLDFELDANPDAEVEISLPSRMGSIQGSGKGNIRFLIDTRGEFGMFGDYVIEKGVYDMTLQNLLNRRFEIRKGSSIRWEGDPYDATLAIEAAYRVRAGLKELRPVGDSSDLFNQRIPVNCIIRLSDRLASPGIRFSFELPESSEEINRIVFSRIDTTNEALVSRQMISLLVLNSFISDEANVNLASGVSSSSFDLLSRQLSNWLSQISRDFDIGVNYRPGGELTNEELELALSTQLFNDRVLIDGNLGLAGDKNTQAASNLVGDVLVEVKLTDDGRFRVKAFNKSNYVDLIDNKAPYTQGVGVFYRKEFDSLEELFKRRRRLE